MLKSSPLPIGKQIFQLMGSLVVAVILLSVFSLLMGWATFVEKEFGTPFATHFIYASGAFRLLIWLLALNVLAAVLARLPWRKGHIPFLLAHVGILLLLMGCYVTWHNGQEAKMVISEGTQQSEAVLPSDWQFQIEVSNPKDGVNQSVVHQFPFVGGPLNRVDYEYKNWNRDITRPAQKLLPNKTLTQQIARMFFAFHHRGVWELTRWNQPRWEKVLYQDSAVRLDLLDYLVSSDFVPATPLTLDFQIGSETNEPAVPKGTTSEVTLDFLKEGGRDSRSRVSSRAVRKTIPTMARVVFLLAHRNDEKRAFLQGLPPLEVLAPLCELVLLQGKETFRFPLTDLIPLARSGSPQEQIPLILEQLRLLDERENNKQAALENISPSLIKETVKEEDLRALAYEIREIEQKAYRNGGKLSENDRILINEKKGKQILLSKFYRWEHSLSSTEELLVELQKFRKELESSKSTLESLTDKVKLGQTGLCITSFQFSPTMLPNGSEYLGYSAVVEITDTKGIVGEVRLHSEMTEGNTTCEELGVSGALWVTISPETDQQLFGTGSSGLTSRWNKDLALPRLELLQTPDDTLYYRWWDGQRTIEVGEVPLEAMPLTDPDAPSGRNSLFHAKKITFVQPSGRFSKPTFQQLPLLQVPYFTEDAGETPVFPGGFENCPSNETKTKSPVIGFRVREFQFNDEPGYQLTPLPFNKETASSFFAKVRLRASFEDGTSDTFWLRTIPLTSVTPEQQRWFTHQITRPEGTISISLTNPLLQLGLAVRVRQFEAMYEPGSSTPSSFSSLVDFIPTDKEEFPKREKVLIRMNRPGVFYDPGRRQSFWAYQDSFRGPFYPGDSNFDQVVQGRLLPDETVPREHLYQTVLSLNNDPGRGLKYLGSFLIVLGTALLIYRRRKQNFLGLFGAMLLALLGSFHSEQVYAVTNAATDASTNDTTATSLKDHLDWTPWQLLPVFDDGRIMPLETYARRVTKEIVAGPLIFTSSESLLSKLQGNTPLDLPIFEQFIAEGNYKKDELPKLKAWYNDVAAQIVRQQKKIAQRIQTLFPKGTREFQPAELLFSWLTEPEIWNYIPFLPDDDQTLSRELLHQNTNTNTNTTVDSSYHRTKKPIRLAPFEWEGTDYSKRLERILTREMPMYDSESEAIRVVTLDFAVARMEQRHSLFRAIVAHSGRDPSACTAWHLDAILYPTHQTDTIPLIEKLNRAVDRLESLLAKEKDKEKSPFSDPQFLLSQKTSIEIQGQQRSMILLMRHLNTASQSCREYPLVMNAALLDRLYSGVTDALTSLRKHRDEIFRDELFSISYRETLLQVTRLLGETAEKLKLASLGLTDAGYYSLSTRCPKELVTTMIDEQGETRYRPTIAPQLSFSESATIKVFPMTDEAVFDRLEKPMSPWVSLQTLLFASDPLYRRFVNPQLTKQAPNSREDQSDDALMALESFIDKLKRDVTQGNPQRRERLAFYEAASAWTSIGVPSPGRVSPGTASPSTVSPSNATRFNEALVRLASSLQTLAGETRAARWSCFEHSSLPHQADQTFFAKVDYPPSGTLHAEFFYTRLNSTYWMWFFCLLSVLFLLPSMVLPKFHRLFFLTGLGFLLLSCLVTLWGSLLRAWITGWAPVTNMFETVVLLGFLISVFSICYCLAPILSPVLGTAWKYSSFDFFGKHCYLGRVGSLCISAIRLKLTAMTIWATFYLCYREHAFDDGIIQTFLDSIAMQGILDRIAVLATMLLVIVYVPRLLTAVLVICLFPQKIFGSLQPVLPVSDKVPLDKVPFSKTPLSLLEQMEQRKIFLLAGAVVALGIGLLAYYNSAEFNPNIRPLAAVLRSNFWLTIHVLAIIISYAMGTIAWGISLVMLTSFLFGSYPHQTDDNGRISISAPLLCQRCAPIILALIQSTVLFLTIGIILGARWADFSWGRFWSWDPKEVWALVTLFIYLVVLHWGRRKGFNAMGLALAAVLGFFAIVMTWYGLSFVFGGGGRHAYVSGQSHKTTILYLLISVNIVWAFLAAIRYGLKKNIAKQITTCQHGKNKVK